MRSEQTVRPQSPAAETAQPTPWIGSHPRWTSFWICAFLAALVWVVFGRTIHYDFVNYDDDIYVYENPLAVNGISLKGMVWAFAHNVSANWHPLTVMSHMLDCRLCGLNAGGHHFTNVLLHAAATLFLFFALKELTGTTWRSAFVAALFAIHPLRVESVAWISERKDVLSGLFFMLTLWAYARYARQKFQLARYLVVVLLFALGLMSKPMLVTLPFVLWLLDYWPLNRLDLSSLRTQTFWRSRLMLEKVPLLLMSAAACVATILAQEEAFRHWPLGLRVSNALVSYVAYLGKMLWPSRLAVYYPFPEQGVPMTQIVAAVFVLVGISVAALVLRQRRPYLLVGWLWYLGMLVPVIGLVQVGGQAMADRYSYLPLIGVFIALTFAGREVLAHFRMGKGPSFAVAALVLAGCGVVTEQQLQYWQDSESLWMHTLASTSDNNARAQSNLGSFLFEKGRFDEAAAHCQKALQIRPYEAAANNCLGVIAFRNGRVNEAIQYFQQAAQSRPNFAPAENNLGKAFLKTDQVGDAIVHFQKAIMADPDMSDAHYNLALALDRSGKQPEAMTQYERALALNPRLAGAHNNLGNIYLQQKQVLPAIRHYQQALEIRPDDIGMENNLAWVLATWPEVTARNGSRALELASDANRRSGGHDLMILRTLAAAFAEAGRYPDAVATVSLALQGAEANGSLAYVKVLRKDLQLYQSGQPLRDPP